MTQRDDSVSSPEARFAGDLKAFTPVLEGWSKRARHLGCYGLEKCLREAAESAASWSRALSEDNRPDHAAADQELIAELEKLCQLMNEQNPDLAAVIVGATLRLKELTSA